MHTLDYLNFDYSEDEALQGTWDAMAYVRHDRVADLLAEVGRILRWAGTLGAPAPIEDGGVWDFDLQAQDASGAPLPVQADWCQGLVQLPHGTPDTLQLTLTLTGSETFAHAFSRQFTWE